ncbi:uncharacterized protein LOC135086582 isoform X1 [Ostrinia nubilalis]|uniref:uncharacterized protein LOC135086582 isoform X1 n=1 Tax=Ostrinia nubilalis TaxID=29057 RepID=UPI0030823F0D
MHSLVPLLFAAVAVCARPPGPTQTPDPPISQSQQVVSKISHGLLGDYSLPRILIPQYLGYEGSPRLASPPRDDWLNKEIDRINGMEEPSDAMGTYEKDIARMIVDEPYFMKMFVSPVMERMQPDIPDPRPNEPLPPSALIQENPTETEIKPQENVENDKEEMPKDFAYTPYQTGYFAPYSTKAAYKPDMKIGGLPESGYQPSVQIEKPRQIRQNPNLSRTKTLIAENLDKLRIGLANKQYRIPVSLMPSNLRWLKISPTESDEESSGDDSGTTDKSIHLMEPATMETDHSIYGVAVITATTTIVTLVIISLGFVWYQMSKKAKMAADVDYPAYGVTGPTPDMSGDRKLAHSAHMYHYQHQKQQIIAMERNGMEQRSGSVSDPESEEENEEGDYTVYECPGFATTGDMEVKNPMFTEEPTPATPGKCEIVKPQPKD